MRAGLTRMVKVTARAVVFTPAAAAVVTLLRGDWKLVALVWGWHRAASHVVAAHVEVWINEEARCEILQGRMLASLWGAAG